MNGNGKLIKLVFKEADDTKPKVLFCYILKDADGFVEVRTTQDKVFVINKTNIVYMREGDY